MLVKCKLMCFLPENVAQSVAMTAEKSTVMAPVSLYAITFIKTISPIAKRPYVPDTIMSVILDEFHGTTNK